MYNDPQARSATDPHPPRRHTAATRTPPGERLNGRIQPLVLLATAVVLAASILVYAQIDYRQARQDAIGRLQTLAQIVGTSASSAWQRGDGQGALSALRRMQMADDTTGATLYDGAGHRIVGEHWGGLRAVPVDRHWLRAALRQAPAQRTWQITDDGIDLVVAIDQEGVDHLLHVEAGSTTLQARRRDFLLTAVLLIVALMSGGYALTRLLQRRVVTPAAAPVDDMHATGAANAEPEQVASHPDMAPQSPEPAVPSSSHPAVVGASAATSDAAATSQAAAVATRAESVAVDAADAADALPVSAASPGASESRLVGAHVLLVEDNEVNQQVALGMLEMLGCTADTADEGRAAVDLVSTRPYDLVLMDCYMPVMDGFEAAQRIRDAERTGGNRRLPIVAMTADARTSTRERCTAAGFDDYLSKPFTQSELAVVLRRHIAAEPDLTASMARAAPTAILDEATLERLRQIGAAQGKDLLSKLVGLFEAQTPRQLAEIRRGLEAGDHEAVALTAHSLKSSAGNLGAVQMAQTAGSLEHAARAEDGEHLPNLAGDLERASDSALKALRELIGDAAPPEAPASATTRGAAAPQRHSANLTERRRILIVDDDPGFRLAAAEVLDAEGFAAATAENGEQALEMIEQTPPDLVLLDAVMPGLDGFEVCHRLRTTSLGRDLPVIMVTGLDDSESMQRAFEAGATGFATKPVGYPALIHRVHFMLRAADNEAELRDHRTLLLAAQRVARLGFWRWYPDSDRFELSDNLRSMLGVEIGDLAHTVDAFLTLIEPDERTKVHARLQAALEGGKAEPFEYRIKAGHDTLTVQQALELISEPGAPHLLGTVLDISLQRASESDVRRMAFYDPLTGLANRSHLTQQLDDTIRVARRRNATFTVLFLDLDGFKDVNDTLGHDIGDAMLVTVARRLQGVLRDVDFVARLGGDEFCILLSEHRDELDAADVANRCLEAVNRPLSLDGHNLQPQVSIGLARFPDDGENAGQLLKAADSAMYAAKQAGKHRYAFYRPEMTEEAERRLALEQQLRRALDEQQFELHYQPQVELVSGAIVGVEVLARWQHPQQGLLPPGSFVGALERSGMVRTFGVWVIRTACRQMAAWRQQGIDNIRLAVNVSRMHAIDPAIVGVVREALESNDIPPTLLELEVTEMSLHGEHAAVDVLRRLRELGVRIAIDDFGSGYSSLGTLKHLPIDALKIDRAFVCNMLENTEDAVVLGTIVGLAHSLGYRVAAEGAEQLEQVKVLAGLRCDIAQGHYFSPPVEADQVPALLARGSLLPEGGQSILPVPPPRVARKEAEPEWDLGIDPDSDLDFALDLELDPDAPDPRRGGSGHG